VLERLKAIKDLILEKLDLTLVRLEALLKFNETLLENQSSLLTGNIYLVRGMQRQGIVLRELRQVTGGVVTTATFDHPEVGLARHLYTWLSSRRALYIGSPGHPAPLELLATGFLVEAISTDPTTGWPEALTAHAGFFALNDAVHGAPELVYCETPAFSLPVGAGSALVVALACDAEGLLERIDKMRAAGFSWYLVLYTTPAQPETAFFCNYPHAPAGIRAQAFFFAEHHLFAAAYDWCAAILPVTRFR